jgi:hypothetical protein
MQTPVFIGSAIGGGLLSTFAAAGWGSYKDSKLPDPASLFRWFLVGLITIGCAAYAWLFGAGGDPSTLITSVGEALEVKEVIQSISSSTIATPPSLQVEELTVGMPNF